MDFTARQGSVKAGVHLIQVLFPSWVEAEEFNPSFFPHPKSCPAEGGMLRVPTRVWDDWDGAAESGRECWAGWRFPTLLCALGGLLGPAQG